MKLAVFGANGPTGRLLTRLAPHEDHDVVAFTRHPDAFSIQHRRLEVVGGDVHDAAAVASAIDGTAAVLSTLGVPFAKTPIIVYSDGVANIIAGMHAAGVKRLACVSSSVLGPHPEPLGGFIFEKMMQPGSRLNPPGPSPSLPCSPASQGRPPPMAASETAPEQSSGLTTNPWSPTQPRQADHARRNTFELVASRVFCDDHGERGTDPLALQPPSGLSARSRSPCESYGSHHRDGNRYYGGLVDADQPGVPRGSS
jgi:hypothetical protein